MDHMSAGQKGGVAVTTNERLLAGAARVDITPELGIQLAGDIGRPRPVEEVRHPLYVRALVLEGEGERACFLAADVTLVMRNVAEELRRRVGEAIGCSSDAVIVHAGQSHSAPSVGNHMISDDCQLVPEELAWVRGGDARYTPQFLEGALAAVREASAALQPVTVKAVRGMDGRVSFNRRFILRDGTVQTHPRLCQADILCAEGPADPEVSLVTFEGESGRPIAALLHHTCHPVHGYPHRYVCPDWPGLWAEQVRSLLGGDCVAMTVNGACGNIHHTNHLDPTYKGDVNRYVACLTETVRRILPDLAPVRSLPLRQARTVLPLPMRNLPADEVAAARELIEDHPEPMWNEAKDNVHWDWVYALATLDLAERQQRTTTYDYETQAFRIGDLALVAWPGEPFVEAQIELKKNSPAAHTFVAHMSSDCAGYLPTREAFAHGGYETRTANWSKLAPEALESVAKESASLLRELFTE